MNLPFSRAPPDLALGVGPAFRLPPCIPLRRKRMAAPRKPCFDRTVDFLRIWKCLETWLSLKSNFTREVVTRKWQKCCRALLHHCSLCVQLPFPPNQRRPLLYLRRHVSRGSNYENLISPAKLPLAMGSAFASFCAQFSTKLRN